MGAPARRLDHRRVGHREGAQSRAVRGRDRPRISRSRWRGRAGSSRRDPAQRLARGHVHDHVPPGVRPGAGRVRARRRGRRRSARPRGEGPARARREAEAALEARRASAEAASRSAAEALGLDEAYLERVRAQRREATRRRDERKKRGDLSFATTSRTEEMRSVAARGVDGATAATPRAATRIGTQKKKRAPEDEAYAALYARSAAERDAARARVAAGRAAAAKRDAASAGIRGGTTGSARNDARVNSYF